MGAGLGSRRGGWIGGADAGRNCNLRGNRFPSRDSMNANRGPVGGRLWAWAGVLFLLGGTCAPLDAADAGNLPRPKLGTNELATGRILYFHAPLSPYARSQAGRLGTNVTSIQGALWLPEEWAPGRAVPLLIVFTPSGAPSIPSLHGYTNVARAAGWAVLAADGPRLSFERDTVLWSWATVSSALAFAEKPLPGLKSWPVAAGGFSGGSKRAASVGAALTADHRKLVGVFMGGCNEDAATPGLKLFGAGSEYLVTPMFLSNGNRDNIAGPQHGANVRAALERNGFRKVRAEIYDGAHRPDETQLRMALEWFGGGGQGGNRK